MIVLVTGGAGYIGLQVVLALLQNNSIKEIILYDLFVRDQYYSIKDLFGNNKLTIVRGDILDKHKLEPLVARADIVCHCAAIGRAPFNKEYGQLFEQTNHWGTADLCSLVAEKNVHKFIYLSSGSVYGQNTKSAFSVSDEPAPVTSYGISKYNAENQLIRLQGKCDVIILRLANVFGIASTMHFNSVIDMFMLKIAFREPLLIHGNGEQYRPFIHITRVVNAIKYFILVEDMSEWNVFNIYDFNLNLNQLLEIFYNLDIQHEVIHVNKSQKFNNLIFEADSILENTIGSADSVEYYILQSKF